jgi:hypothetical protein
LNQRPLGYEIQHPFLLLLSFEFMWVQNLTLVSKFVLA